MTNAAPVFPRFNYWSAWPNNHMPTEDFARKSEAARYVAVNGGGSIRKFRQLSEHVSETSMDPIEIGALKS